MMSSHHNNNNNDGQQQQHHGWRDASVQAEDRAYAAAAARAERLNAELGIPSYAASLLPRDHHALVVQHALDPYYGERRAQEMARAVMEARAEKERLRATLSLGEFARYSRPDGAPSASSFAASAQRNYGEYANNPYMRPPVYSPDDHFAVPPTKRGAAWHAADAEMRRTPMRSALDYAHPLRHYHHSQTLPF